MSLKRTEKDAKKHKSFDSVNYGQYLFRQDKKILKYTALNLDLNGAAS